MQSTCAELACRQVCSSRLLLLAIFKGCSAHNQPERCLLLHRRHLDWQALYLLLLHTAVDDQPLGALTASALRAAVPAI